MEWTSEPYAVTVHRSGATVERRIAIVDPKAGPIVLPGLPLSLEDGTIAAHVESQGGGEVQLTAVRSRLHARRRAEAPETPDHQALRDTQDELARAQRKLAHLREELELLDGIDMPSRPEPPEGQAPPPSPLAARVALDAFVDQQTAARHDAIRQLQESERELRKEEAALKDAIRRHAGAKTARPDELSKAVHGTLLVNGTVSHATVVLRYRVPGARWVPQYILDVHRDTATLRLQAGILQASGEDWTGVKLTLSTALPHAYCPLPTLRSVRIGKVQEPPPASPPRPAPIGSRALYADFDQARAKLATPTTKGAIQAPVGGSRPVPPSPPSEAFEAAMMMGASAALDDAFADEESAAEMPMSMPMPEPAPAAPPRARSARRKEGAASGKRKARKPAKQAPTTPPIYALLHLPEPTHPQRTALRVADAAALHVAALERSGVTLSTDPLLLLQAATQHALATAHTPRPAHTEDVRPSHFDHAVTANLPVDIAGDGVWHTVPIDSATGPCRIRYVGVPREDPQLYRVAALANALGTPLLPGPVDVHVNGAYVLTASLPASGPGEDVHLSLGVEPALRIARNTRFEEARSGDRVAMTELHHHITIEVLNTLDRDAEIEVRERVPIPDGDAEVAIDIVATSPDWQAYDQKERGNPVDGGHRWTVTVPAGAEQTLSAHYVVRLYANHEVVGGNRREA